MQRHLVVIIIQVLLAAAASSRVVIPIPARTLLVEKATASPAVAPETTPATAPAPSGTGCSVPCGPCCKTPDSRSPCAQECINLIMMTPLFCKDCASAQSLSPDVVPKFCGPKTDGTVPEGCEDEAVGSVEATTDLTRAFPEYVNNIGVAAGVTDIGVGVLSSQPVCPPTDCCCDRATYSCKTTVCSTVTCPDYAAPFSAYCVLPDDGTPEYAVFVKDQHAQECCCDSSFPKTAVDGTPCSSITCPFKISKQLYCTKAN